MRALHFPQDQAGLLGEQLAELRERDAARMPLDQGDTQLLLQRFHRLGKGRLGDVQPLGRARQAWRLGNDEELAELAQIHYCYR